MARAWVRAFSDDLIDFGLVYISFSLEEGEYDMSRLRTSGIPFEYAHTGLKLGEVVDYEVRRPDPEREGTAAMYLAVEFLPEEQLHEQARSYVRQILAGTMRGTSGGWDTSQAYAQEMDEPVGRRTRLFGAVKLSNWAMIEDSATNTPKVPSARIVSLTAAAGGSPIDEAQIRAWLARAPARTGGASMVTPAQNTDAVQAVLAELGRLGVLPTEQPAEAPAAAPAQSAAQVSAPPEAGSLATSHATDVVQLQAQIAQLVAQQQAQPTQQQAAQPAQPPVAQPASVAQPAQPAVAQPAQPAVAQPAQPAQQATSHATDVVQLQSQIAQLAAQQAAQQQVFADKLNSISIQPQTIEQAASAASNPRFHMTAAMTMQGFGAGSATVSERDYPYTRKRLAEIAEATQDNRLIVPPGERGLVATRRDLWGPRYDPERLSATISTDVVQVIDRQPLVRDSGIEMFPYRERLRVIQATGQTRVPFVKTRPTVRRPAEGATAGVSSYATEKEDLTPHAAAVQVDISMEAAFLDPNVDGEVREMADRLMLADDQAFVEATYHASTAPQGVYQTTGATKVVGGAAGGSMTLDKVYELDGAMVGEVKDGLPYFYVLNDAVFQAMRGVAIDQGSGIFLINGDANMGTTAQTGVMAYRSSNLPASSGVLIVGPHYYFCEWQGVVVTQQIPTGEQKVEYTFRSFRDGVAVYPKSFPYVAES